MEQSNSLLLNEEALRQCPDPSKPVFIYEWLRYLDRILPATRKADIKTCQEKLLEQLTLRITAGPGPPARMLLAKCIAKVFAITDTYDLFQTINICNDALKAKEDSGTHLQVKLTALCVLGVMYENLGRMVGRSFEESFQAMVKWIKSADSGSRAEILNTFSKMIHGLGSAAHSIHKDLYKLLSKNYLTDRVLNVRAAAVKCLASLVSEQGSPIYSHDIDSICTLALKALDSSDYQVRQEVAKVFTHLVLQTSGAQKSALSPAPQSSQKKPSPTSKDVFGFMAASFLRGGVGGFLKTTGKVLHGASATVQKETRIGMALAYVEAANKLGVKWLERNIQFWIQHLLGIVSKFGEQAYTNDASQSSDVVFMRRCILYIFRNTLGVMLSEQYQITACKHFGAFLMEYTSHYESLGDTEEERILSGDVYASAEASAVILLEISALVRQVGTAIRPIFVEASGIMEPVFASLIHPVYVTRVSAAWCLRCITLAVPSQSTPLIDRCLNRLEHMKKHVEAISGFSLALAALLAGSRDSELGIPFCKSRQVFALAEDMIKTATQSPKLALKKISAGWLLMSSVISMGSPFVKQNNGRIVMLWKYSFPRSVDEAKAEKARGDTFTWECTLESRAGALASMEAFLRHCPELVTDDLIKKIVLPVETCLTTMVLVADLLLSHGVKLRTPIHFLRIRLYALLMRHIQLRHFDALLSALLRELVADITLTDNAQATTTSSLICGMCAAIENCLLGGWIKNTTQAYLELPIHPLQTVGFGAIEYDSLHLVHGPVSCSPDDNTNFLWPEPLPAQVVSIDSAIQLFGKIFPVLQTKRKLQLMNHFLNGFKNIKQGPRLNAIQLNVLGAVHLAMKSMGDAQRNAKIDDEELQRVTVDLTLPHLNAERALLKCLAIETLGRIAQAVAEPQFVAGNAQFCFDKLRSIRDEKSRTGYALSLGCLHRYMGSLGSGQHLNTSVSIVLALAQDNSSPTVQAWSILSLSLIASTGGGMFRGYVEPSLSLCLRLLLGTPSTHVEVIHSIAKLTSALITAVGPELPTTIGTVEHTRTSFLIACSMMFEHSDAQIKAEAIYCLQQLHLFAPRFVQLDRLVVNICNLLHSEHLILRKAAICCLRQLLQREAKEVREHAQTLVPAGLIIDPAARRHNNQWRDGGPPPLPDTGLEGALFELLDTETEREIRQHIKECLMFLMHATCGELLNFWLTTCKDILASSANQEIVRSTIYIDEAKAASGNITTSASGTAPAAAAGVAGGAASSGNGAGASAAGTSGDDDGQEIDLSCDVDDTLQGMGGLAGARAREKIAPRWPTRVFGFEVVQKLMAACDNERAHLDLALAKELQMSSGEGADYLVLHLSDLVRMGFMGATSDNSELRLAGLNCLQEVIVRFSAVPEPEFPGHVILEQFQAQVGAALRPAFEPQTPSHVTAAACQVCSTWIGSGVARDLNDLRRVHQLLVSSLTKLRHGSINTQLYNESAATLEKLSILKAWAEVYFVAVRQQEEPQTEKTEDARADEYTTATNHESLLSLVNPELNVLVGHWLAALRDSAILSLPADFADQLPEGGGAFYTPDSAESCKEYYRSTWPPILLATSIWLKRNNFDTKLAENCDPMRKWSDERRESRFHLMVGMCVEWLCNSRQYNDHEDRTIELCLNTLKNLIDCEWSQLELMRDVRLPIEIMNVLYRLILTRDNLLTQRSCAEVVAKILTAAETAMRRVNGDDVTNGNIDAERAVYSGYNGGEGDGASFDPQTSLAFATLEVCLCLLVRQIPQINSALMKSKSLAPLHFRKYARLPMESYELIHLAIRLLVKVPRLCSAEGALVVLPTVLYLILGVLRESSRVDALPPAVVAPAGVEPPPPPMLVADATPGHVSMAATTAIVALRTIYSSPLDVDESNMEVTEAWESVLRSALLSLLNMLEGEVKVDKTVVMLAATIMVTTGPSRLTFGTTLFSRLCRLYKSCLDASEAPEVQQKALQSVASLFLRREIRAAFVGELGAAVFAKIRPYVVVEPTAAARNSDGDAEAENTEPRPRPPIKSETELPMLEALADSELHILQEAIKAVEAVLKFSKDEKERIFVNLLVRTLVRFLCPDPDNRLRGCHTNVRAIHDFSLQHLNAIGLDHPEAFKAILSACPDIHQRIELAAHNLARSRQFLHSGGQKPPAAANGGGGATQKPVRPTIKLAMDFSSFK